MWLYQVVSSLQNPQRLSILALSQLSLMLSFYEHHPLPPGRKALISREFLISSQGRVDTHLQKNIAGNIHH
jgi:hypothetical protein